MLPQLAPTQRTMLDEVIHKVGTAQQMFRERLERLESAQGGLTEERYARYLSMQYHLTRGVQRHFMIAASHHDMAQLRSLRRFLLHFAEEEESHFAVARKDLVAMGRDILPCPLDVELWWSYFDRIVAEQPFVRLGATCVLENLSTGAKGVIGRLMANASYLRADNSRFFVIHRHDESLPHGEQIMQALASVPLAPRHLADLVRGVEVATVMYMRMVEWAIDETSYGEGALLGVIGSR